MAHKVRGNKNREEIGAGAKKSRLHGRAPFLSENRKWPFTVFFIGEMPWQIVNRFWQ